MIKELYPIITVMISGFFGLIVAITTWKLANRRETARFKLDIEYKDLKDKEDLYITILASIDKTIKLTKTGESYKDLLEEYSLNSAKMNILGAHHLNLKLGKVSDILYEWSTVYKESLPKKIGDTNFAISTNLDYEHRQKANEIYITLKKEINELVEEIKLELDKIRDALYKTKN